MAFSDVELTEDEICKALISAKSQKQSLIDFEKNAELRRQRGIELTQPFTPPTLINYCHRFYKERTNNDFIIEPSNQEIIKHLSNYFTGNKEFEVGDYSLNKGLLIMGSVGIGKTELMKFFQKNKKCCFKIESCNDIADSYLTYQEETEAVYASPIKRPLNDPDFFFQREIGYCFDDLGTEDVKNNFGNKKNVMADIILAIYSKKDFSKFHITTNLDADGIEQKYGTRVRSRLREMFNVFTLTGNDKRK